MFGFGFPYNTINPSSDGGAAFDPDAEAFFTAASITDATQKNAVNQLVLDLKTYNIWTKMKAIYPIVGGTSATHKWNLKDPRDLDAAFRLTFSTGWTHSSTGMTGNGTSAFADSFLIPATSLSSSNNHLSVYSRTDASSTIVEVGSYTASSPYFYYLMYLKSAGNLYVIANGNTSFPNYNNPDSLGLHLMTKTSASNASAFKNNTKVINNQPVGTGISSHKVFLGAANAAGTASLFSARQISFVSMGDGLTDTESSNLFYSIEKFQTTLGRNVTTNLPTVSDTDAQSFINSANITDVTQANAVNDLVIGLKADGLWTKMKALYPIVGGSASSHAVNLKTPGTYNLTFTTGWTHASTGMTPNGTSAYSNTNFNVNLLQQNSSHFSYYSRTNSQSGHDAGAIEISAPFYKRFEFLIRYTDNNSYNSLMMQSAQTAVAVTDSKAFWLMSRTNSTQIKQYKNNSLWATNNQTSVAPFNALIYLGKSNGQIGFYSNKEVAFSSIGDGLTDADANNLNTRVQSFQTNLNRQV